MERRRPRLRVPRPLRWLLVLVAIAGGWAAGDLLDANAQRRQQRQQQNEFPPIRPAATTTAS